MKDIVAKDTNNSVAITDSDQLSPQVMAALESKLPEFVKEYQVDGTAVLRWMHEYLILMQEILRLDFGFSEDDLVKVEKRIKEMLPVIHKMKMEDTKLLRKADFAVAMAIVERNKVLFKAEASNIKLPQGKTKLIK